tara:strand:- start:2775 stop:3212 length:438 start_codon:yes stop_codon:yes gene_type:complete
MVPLFMDECIALMYYLTNLVSKEDTIMSNDNNSKQSWSSIAMSLVNKVADVNLNPAAAIKGVIKENQEKPLTMSMKAIKDRQKELSEEEKTLKAIQKIVKKADYMNTELSAWADELAELGLNVQADQVRMLGQTFPPMFASLLED